ncbi:MAG: ABC transporter ATP-binding protein [Thermoleophilia bacterium]|nr:ABC transporter ATP-binding protein [Thermoleophilia bacterium]
MSLASRPPVYDIRDLQVELGGRPVLGPLDLQISSGSFVGIVGPNGSGKTTLLRTLTGTLRPTAGHILFEGRQLSDYRALELARVVGVVPQQFTLDFSFTVEEMVAMGRYAHTGRRTSAHTDRAAAATGAGPRTGGVGEDAGRLCVATALQATGMETLARRYITELSGGERQRALIAQTLAQETPVLLLDEPLNNLDLNHQLEIMQLLCTMNQAGRTIAVVLHDLNMAAQYCDELLLLERGRVAARGRPQDVLDPRLILEVFKVRVSVHRQGRRPYLTPLWSEPAQDEPAAGRAAVHVVAGGGAASELVEELVLRGYTPTVGIVSVFDTDYATAQRFELEVVSAPPFEPFPADAIQELEDLAAKADVIVVAPVFFGRGNLSPLRTALRLARTGKRVIVVGDPPVEERDLSGGEATALTRDLLAAGAIAVKDARDAVEKI